MLPYPSGFLFKKNQFVSLSCKETVTISNNTFLWHLKGLEKQHYYYLTKQLP